MSDEPEYPEKLHERCPQHGCNVLSVPIGPVQDKNGTFVRHACAAAIWKRPDTLLGICGQFVSGCDGTTAGGHRA